MERDATIQAKPIRCTAGCGNNVSSVGGIEARNAEYGGANCADEGTFGVGPGRQSGALDGDGRGTTDRRP